MTKVERGTFRVEFPDIFRTLILNREIMPGGRGKRLRVRGEFSEVVVNVQANQVKNLLNLCQSRKRGSVLDGSPVDGALRAISFRG